MATAGMKDSDVVEVSELLWSCYTALGEKEGLSADQTEYLCSQRGSEACVRRESQCQRYLVEHQGGRIVGMVAVAGDTIAKLYVSPEYSGRGVGRSLYEAAETMIREHGHPRVWLGAFPTAVPFYERMGLSVVGEKAATGPLAGRKMMLMEKKLDSGAA
jgi:GNAT superfamily N-acetyltransferase